MYENQYMRVGRCWIFALVSPWMINGPAQAQTVVGYQLGVTQSVGTTLGDDLTTLQIQAQQNQVNPTAPGDQTGAGITGDAAGADVDVLQGIQFNTTLTGNLTFDWVTNLLSHGLVVGAAVTQLIPVAVPEPDDPDAPDPRATLREQLTTVTANATYLTRIQRPRWSFALGGSYVFALNGRLQNGANGGQQGNAANGTLPASNAGAFAFSGTTHTGTGNVLFQLNRLRWDAAFSAIYTYTQNGIYTLAAGAPGAQGAAAAANTNIGAFTIANLHTIAPQITLRTRLGNRGTLTADVVSTYSVPTDSPDEVTVDGVDTVIVRATNQIPETLINTARIEYLYRRNLERAFGADVNAVFGLRVPTDAQGIPLAQNGQNPTLSSDTLIYTARLVYQDLLPGELTLRAAAGAAQAQLLQAPLGVEGNPDDFLTVRSDWEPVLQVALQRRFDPVDATLTLTRDVGVGAFGASAIVTEAAALTFTHIQDFDERRLTTNLGFNANRTNSVGQDLFNVGENADPLAFAFNNQGFGVNLGMALPVLVEGPWAIDAALTYNFNWVDSDPDQLQGIPTALTHALLLNLRVVFGRGTAQGAVGAGGRNDTDELDAFSANPRDGSSLITQRLLNRGAPMDVGARPGEAPRSRRDSRQAYQQNIRQARIEQETREASGAVLEVGTVEEEERRTLEREKEEQKKREDERERDFGEWPIESIPLPNGPN